MTAVRRLPSLNALRAFEAAARHRSFTKAAQELNVTQAAVSHQIKALEESLGLPLFERLNRALVLTDAGREYLPILSEAFDLIDVATRRLARSHSQGALKISIIPSFAAKWVLPRLPRFRERHPDIDVLLSAKEAMVDFGRDDIDIGLRFGPGRYPGLAVEPLMTDRKFPVCSPKLLHGRHPLREPEDLRFHTLLQDDVDVLNDGITITWTKWLQAAGVHSVDGGRGPGFTDSSMVLAAAIAGHGVALARASLAGDDIASDLLVKPFGPELRTVYSYWMVTRPDGLDSPKVQAFRTWLLEEVRAFVAEQQLEIPKPPR